MPSDMQAFLGSGLVKGTADTFRLRQMWQKEHPEGDVSFEEWLKKHKTNLPNMPRETGMSGG